MNITMRKKKKKIVMSNIKKINSSRGSNIASVPRTAIKSTSPFPTSHPETQQPNSQKLHNASTTTITAINRFANSSKPMINSLCNKQQIPSMINFLPDNSTKSS
jgi:hypothetical protein